MMRSRAKDFTSGSFKHPSMEAWALDLAAIQQHNRQLVLHPQKFTWIKGDQKAEC